jgi:MinD superfamily P-loop ATPase
MRISIASGKGGTGKTTVATGLALSIGTGVRFLDCDVEAPNAHLFLHPEFHREIPVGVPVPAVNPERCNGCGKCAEICRYNAIAALGGAVLTFPELCHGCGGCMEICPEKAVTETSRHIGTIEVGDAGGIAFIHGKLRIGEAMSPPLIRAVIRMAGSEELTIIDAPPGTSCPVITAIKDSDFVLLVSEPTPFGLHDLKLAVAAVRILGIPHGLVINRSDIGDAQLRTYAENENIPILMEIPFDREIATAYSNGIPMVEALPRWRAHFAELQQRIRSVVEGGNASR